MQKVRYEIDPFNRLIVIGRGKGLERHRKVIDGVFRADKNNSLTYHVKSPDPETGFAPHQVKLKGSWSLTKDHNLRITLDKWKRTAAADSIEISGDIIDVRGNAILFSVTTRRADGSRNTYILELAGTWQADKNNRLTFRVKKEKGRYDVLTFEGAWEIDSDNELVYRYEKARLTRKTRTIHTLIFKGRWRPAGRAVLSYAIEAGPRSVLDFKTSLGICGPDYIKYELGIILGSSRRPVKRAVTLFGSWKISKGTGLSFDVQCADGNAYSVSFEARARLTARDTIIFRCSGIASRKSPGLELEITRALLQGDGAAFFRFLRSANETAVFVGAGFRW